MSSRGQAWVQRNRSYERIADEFERACLQVLSPREDGCGWVVLSGPCQLAAANPLGLNYWRSCSLSTRPHLG